MFNWIDTQQYLKPFNREETKAMLVCKQISSKNEITEKLISYTLMIYSNMYKQIIDVELLQ